MSRRILSYPGSKWNIAQKIVKYIPEHHTYVEPYFGSGAVLFNKPHSAIETVNDLDDTIVNFFNCLREHTEELAWKIRNTPYSRIEYDRAYRTLKTSEDPMEKAVALMICSWQGHGYRLNEKVGWKSDIQGREYAYSVKEWNDLPDIIRDTAIRLKNVQIENQPAVNIIKRYDHANVFMYIDPPYPLSVRSKKQYSYEMSDSDHEDLLKLLCRSKAKIMISCYNNKLYNDYLSSWQKKTFPVTIQNGKSRLETIWCNYPIPNIVQESFF